MKLAILMDAPEKLKPWKDTTIALMKKAEILGYPCVFFTHIDVFSKDGAAFAKIHSLKIKDEHQKDWFETKVLGVQPLSDFDVILMRKDPPITLEYMYLTYTLDLAEKAGVLVANTPQGLRNANEKFFTLQFPQCCPETLVSSDISLLRDFHERHGQVIFKPLEGMGGQSVFHVEENGKNLPVILEMLTANQTITIMAQRYIPDICHKGDKRILLINGEPVSHALARIPSGGDIRGNLAAGARGEVSPINEKDRWIASQIAPVLKEQGLYFVGIDVIGDYLTEINVTSPTCLQEISDATGLDIAGDYLQFLAKKLTIMKRQSQI